MKLLEGKVAIITGGTRGIGFEIVRTFLENGAKVALCGSRQETADKAAAKLREENPEWEIEAIAPDLSDPASVKEAFTAVKDKWGRIDVLGNNAGISARDSLYEYDPEDFKRLMDLNVNSVFYGIQAVAPIMKEQGGGSIINTSSMVGRYGQPRGCAYPTSKFAVNGLTLSLARELAPDGIRVNAVSPGVTHTDMVDNLPESVIQPLIASIPLGRMGTPKDIANAYLFLASDMSSYISGQILGVDGLSRP
ncbi:MAG: 3-oxoacyl-ACP reductase family protein [Coriobacteriia bacterium]|nr:3-oxoacyl-ACP reductase family protein [Coriobacteriia bacterium]